MRPVITGDPAKPRRLRRAGARWRLLVHDVAPRGGQRAPAGMLSAEARRTADELRAKYSTETILPGTEFDELVVGHWLHIEQMDVGSWWMSIGGVTVHVRADRDGRPTSVTVHGPLDYEGETRPGVAYNCVWTDPLTKETKP